MSLTLKVAIVIWGLVIFSALCYWLASKNFKGGVELDFFLKYKWISRSSAIILATLTFFFWDFIKTNLSNWLTGSVIEERLGLESSEISEFLWIPATLFIIWLVIRLWSGRKKEVSGNKKGTAGLELVFVLVGIIAFMTTTYFVFDQALANEGRGCTTQKQLNELRHITNPYPLTICPDKGKLYVDRLSGQRLQFGLEPEFVKEYGHLFGGQSHEDVISKFMTINPPMTYPGSIANSYRIVPYEDQIRYGQVSPFKRYNLPYVRLVVKPI